MAEPSENDEQDKERYVQKMQKRKVFHERLLEENQKKKGLMIVHTGKGKGKSTAAFGMIVRALGHGYKVALIQFVKGPMHSAEREVFSRFGDQIVVAALGEGFTWNTQDFERDAKMSRFAWERARTYILDPAFRLVVLDEINIALRYGHFDPEDVLDLLNKRPKDSHVVLTGRNAKAELIEAADLVTEMNLVKHPFRSGIQAQAGIEF